MLSMLHTQNSSTREVYYYTCNNPRPWYQANERTDRKEKNNREPALMMLDDVLRKDRRNVMMMVQERPGGCVGFKPARRPQQDVV